MLAAGLAIPGTGPRILHLSHGSLTVSLRRASQRLVVSIKPSALAESNALLKQIQHTARDHRSWPVHVPVSVINTAHKSTDLKLQFLAR